MSLLVRCLKTLVKYPLNTYFKFKRKYYKYLVCKTAVSVGSLVVNGKSKVNKNTIIGNNVYFNGMNIEGWAKVTIGDNFHSGRGCIMMTSNHNYDAGEFIPYDSTYIHREIAIGDNVWLGMNVTILGGVTIGEGAIIQIGSVVVSDIPSLAIAGGHPAKVYKFRDKDHYDRLKSEAKFY